MYKRERLSLLVTSILLFSQVHLPSEGGEPSAAPDLSFRVEPSAHPDPECFGYGDEVLVAVHLGPAQDVIIGAQFVVLYDVDCLQFNGAWPVEEPYTMEIFETNDSELGVIVYAVGIEFGGEGQNGDADLAVLSFNGRSSCSECVLCFDEDGPINTYLSNELGQPIFVIPHCSEPIETSGDWTVNVPPDTALEVECELTANLSWNQPTLEGACASPALACTGHHVDGDYDYDLETVLQGGVLEAGTSEFCCTLQDACGESSQSCWSVVVEPSSSIEAPTGEPMKNRYLSIMPKETDRLLAYRVTIEQASAFPEAVGLAYWVGPPELCNDVAVGSTFLAAALQCDPFYAVWSASEAIHIFGSSVIPNATFTIEAIAQGCDQDNPVNFTPPLVIQTGPWGDVVEPFQGAAFDDIAAIVHGFQGYTYAPPKRVLQLQPTDPNPHANVSFEDATSAVQAFLGQDYPFDGPDSCP